MKASSLLPDGSYCRKVNTLAPCNSQEAFMERSIHKPCLPLPEKAEARHRFWDGLLGRRKK